MLLFTSIQVELWTIDHFKNVICCKLRMYGTFGSLFQNLEYARFRLIWFIILMKIVLFTLICLQILLAAIFQTITKPDRIYFKKLCFFRILIQNIRSDSLRGIIYIFIYLYIYTRKTPAFGGIFLDLRWSGAIGAHFEINIKKNKKIGAPLAPHTGRR